MKFCSTCKEEFADKFSFCPVDGTPLDVRVSEPVVRASQPEVRASAPEVRATEPKGEESGPASFAGSVDDSFPVVAAAAAGSQALVRRDELHLTIIDDAGLVGRLAKELSYVAHEYQLTWPEFKRDPFGFTKRSLVGYGQMASKFFGNRNIIAGLIVAVVALAGLVGIMALLDRAQPGGISRTGFVTFSIIAGVILAAIFITWLSKSRSGAVLGA